MLRFSLGASKRNYFGKLVAPVARDAGDSTTPTVTLKNSKEVAFPVWNRPGHGERPNCFN